MLIACFYLPEIGIATELARVPFYRDFPLALAGREGTILAVSDIARRSGVSRGMTVTGARALCRELVVLSYDRAAYEEAAEAVWDLLATESSFVEPVSPEMSFVQLNDQHSVQSAEALGSLLAKHVGVTVKIGIGSSKLVSEQAARKDDQYPMVRVGLGREAVFLASVPLSSLESVNPVVKQRLLRLGVNTLGDILRLPEHSLSRQFKDSARLLMRLAVGEDGDPVRPLWPPPMLEHEVSFEEETGRTEEILEAIKECAASISQKLATQRIYCRKLVLVASFLDSSETRLSEPLRFATNLTQYLAAAGQRLLLRAAIDRPLARITLIAGGLGAGAGVQLTLLGESDQTREEQLLRKSKLDETMNYVRKRFGISAVIPASLFKTMRQVQLWVYPLGQRKRESVMVATDQEGRPKRFYRHRNCVRTKHEITEVQDQWDQASWSWESILETHCYRVVTDPWGLHQLEQLGVEWTLTATAD